MSLLLCSFGAERVDFASCGQPWFRNFWIFNLENSIELKKQSSCSVRLVNKSDHHVAFKVKTTSPKKYCVRPNTGVIKPRSTCDFTVTMQAQRSAPVDVICKDKFLIQSTVVPAETLDGSITASTFSKDGKYVEESKLKIVLVPQLDSPVLSPIHGTLKQDPTSKASVLKEQALNGVEALISHDTVPVSEVPSLKDQVLSRVEAPIQGNTVSESVYESIPENGVELEPAKSAEGNRMRDLEELKLVKDMEEMKSKLSVLESKLAEAEVTISKLTEERRSATQERQSLQQELVSLRSKKSARRVQPGFPPLFVIMVALVGIMLGHLIRHK